MTQSGPFRCTNMVITITVDSTPYTVGVVDGVDISLSYEGGAEPYYGSRIRKHSAGTKKASVSLTRWFYSDTGQEDLLLNLFKNEVEFSLEGSLSDNSGNSITGTSIKVNNVMLYEWKPKTGSADDLIGEEASGEGLDWTFTITNRTP